MFTKYLAILTTLTVLTSASPTLLNVVEDVASLEQAQIKVDVQFPAHTKYINGNKEEDTFFGDGSKSTTHQFKFDPVETTEDRWKQAGPFYWLIYDEKADIDKLEDKDILYRMTCYAQHLKSNTSPTAHSMELLTTPPFINSLGEETTEEMIKIVNVVCGGDGCVKEDGCGDAEEPEFSREWLDNYFVNLLSL
ncbi:uncharacterized protein IL334_005365 [Kwoniella shivajii]|uniref:Uncharacterized protein n=1 Tax=Kwoniella shivajii TaxID=564305 RepID=A0ABZ1D4Z9_9TREE|nr:hypothetical protein IL334_005365 [Kwoniella shivajii]